MIKKGEPDLVSSCLSLKIVNSPPMCELHRPGEIYRWRPWETWTPQKYCHTATTWRLQYDTKRWGPGLAYYLRPPCFDFPRLCFPSLNPPSGKTNTCKVHEHPFKTCIAPPLQYTAIGPLLQVKIQPTRKGGYSETLVVVTNGGQIWFEYWQWTRLNASSRTYWECC